MTTVLEFFDWLYNTRLFAPWAWAALNSVRALEIVALSACLGKGYLLLREIRRPLRPGEYVRPGDLRAFLEPFARLPLLAFVITPIALLLLYFVMQVAIGWQLGPTVRVGVGSAQLLVGLTLAWSFAAFATILDRLTRFLVVAREETRERRRFPREASAG